MNRYSPSYPERYYESNPYMETNIQASPRCIFWPYILPFHPLCHLYGNHSLRRSYYVR